jgi:hypothetical protein
MLLFLAITQQYACDHRLWCCPAQNDPALTMGIATAQISLGSRSGEEVGARAGFDWPNFITTKSTDLTVSQTQYTWNYANKVGRSLTFGHVSRSESESQVARAAIRLVPA